MFSSCPSHHNSSSFSIQSLHHDYQPRRQDFQSAYQDPYFQITINPSQTTYLPAQTTSTKAQRTAPSSFLIVSSLHHEPHPSQLISQNKYKNETQQIAPSCCWTVSRSLFLHHDHSAKAQKQHNKPLTRKTSGRLRKDHHPQRLKRQDLPRRTTLHARRDATPHSPSTTAKASKSS